MTDAAEDLRRANLVKITAFLTRSERMPDRRAAELITDPVKIPVRIEFRKGGGRRDPSRIGSNGHDR